MPHNEGISAICRSLEAQIDPLKRILTRILNKHILTKNYFEFKLILYIQKQGTAVGTRMAPSCTNIFMRSLEQEILHTVPQKKTKI